MSIENSYDLKKSLAETLQGINAGKITPAAANAAANVSGKYMQLVKMELDFSKASGKPPVTKFFDRTDRKLLSYDEREESHDDHGDEVDEDTGEVTPITKKKKYK